MSPIDINQRYQRQILLKEFGETGQQKLLHAKVLVIGAGGLGCPALLYLAAAGIGTIGVVDFDVVDISNLQRQILYTVDDIGKSKAETAAKRLKPLNPEIQLMALNFKLQTSNALKIISDYDLVIDGSDNFSTRYLVNDACVLLNKPLVYGAVLRFEGQIGVFNLADKASGIKTNYRDLFPEPPEDGSAISCNEAGVLGVVPGIIGTMQATEAIKMITGIGEVLCNSIVSYNVLSNSFYRISILPNEESKVLIPKTEIEFLSFDYEWFCDIHPSTDEISIEAFDVLLLSKKVSIIDVREKGELPVVDEFAFTQFPFSLLNENMNEINASETIIIFCQTGKRSAKAVAFLRKKIPGCKALSLAGGIVAWKKHHQKITN